MHLLKGGPQIGAQLLERPCRPWPAAADRVVAAGAAKLRKVQRAILAQPAALERRLATLCCCRGSSSSLKRDARSASPAPAASARLARDVAPHGPPGPGGSKNAKPAKGNPPLRVRPLDGADFAKNARQHPGAVSVYPGVGVASTPASAQAQRVLRPRARAGVPSSCGRLWSPLGRTNPCVFLRTRYRKVETVRFIASLHSLVGIQAP